MLHAPTYTVAPRSLVILLANTGGEQ